MNKGLLQVLIITLCTMSQLTAQQITEIGRINVGDKGFTDIRGVKVGPDGKIWFVSYAAQKVIRIDNELVQPWMNLDAYFQGTNTYTEIATSGNDVSSPVDLDFNPVRPNELWVLNQGTESSGGITNIISDAGGANQSIQTLTDGNAWHFMALATAIAFGDDGNWATSQGILDANRNGTNFTGPTLWPGDLDIYTKVGSPPTMTVNGSHLDMVHQSPYSMGIAHEKDNVYWVFDGFNDNIIRYDFQEPHYPGGDDHSDAIVRRYPEVQVERKGTLPAHLVVDEFSGLLFICDTDNGRILQLAIHSGSFGGALTPANNEPLAEYSQYTNVTWGETVTGLQDPVGIDVTGNNYMVVTDNATNEIIVYNTQAITAVKHAPEKPQFSFSMFPNPAKESIKFTFSGIEEHATLNVSVFDQLGKKVIEHRINTDPSRTLNVAGLSSGVYYVTLSNDDHFSTQKLLID